MITSTVIQKIRQIIRFFETSKITGADYGALTVLSDGPGNRKQVTYGASQTTEYGNLKILIQMYAQTKGKYAADLGSFVQWIGDISRSSLADNPRFLHLLKEAAKDPLMQQAQDRFFMIYYFNPARQWFDRNGFTYPLSLLVIYDSYVHSGSILDFLRNKFPAKVPTAGGDEKAWITQYVDARDHWLETHTSRPILRKTDYRTDSFIHAIREDNWLLNKPFQVVNYPDNAERLTPEEIAAIN